MMELIIHYNLLYSYIVRELVVVVRCGIEV